MTMSTAVDTLELKTICEALSPAQVRMLREAAKDERQKVETFRAHEKTLAKLSGLKLIRKDQSLPQGAINDLNRLINEDVIAAARLLNESAANWRRAYDLLQACMTRTWKIERKAWFLTELGWEVAQL